MQLERLGDLGMLPPQVIAHPPGRDGVADRHGADQAGDEPLAQDPGQLHRFPPPDGRPSANIRRLAGPGRKPGVTVNWARPNPEEIMTVSRSLVFPLCLVAGPLLVIVAGT